MTSAAAYGFTKRVCCVTRPRSGAPNTGSRAESWTSAAVSAGARCSGRRNTAPTSRRSPTRRNTPRWSRGSRGKAVWAARSAHWSVMPCISPWTTLRRGSRHREQRVLQPSSVVRASGARAPSGRECVHRGSIHHTPARCRCVGRILLHQTGHGARLRGSRAGAGFKLVDDVDATSETLPFWEESAAWTKAVLDSDSSLSAVERRQLRISLMANQALGAEWQAGGLRLGFLRFELE